MKKAEIQVYFKSGQKFVYTIQAETTEELASKAREHEYAIMQTGFRHVGPNEHTWYGVHWIDKIKVVGIDVLTTYQDMATGT